MVSLVQMNKIRDLLRDGWQSVDRSTSEVRLGGPALMVKLTPSHVKVYPGRPR